MDTEYVNSTFDVENTMGDSADSKRKIISSINPSKNNKKDQVKNPLGILKPYMMALLIGPSVGIIIALLNWGIFVLAKSLTNLQTNQVIVLMSSLLFGSLVMGVILKYDHRLAGPGIDIATLAMTDINKQGAWYWLPLKFIATFLCLGAGGGGLVGPSYFIGTSMGFFWNKILHLKDKTKTQVMALLGAGAGVGAVLKLPVSGVLVALESVSAHGMAQLSIYNIVPALLASLLAYFSAGIFQGFKPFLFLKNPLPLIESWGEFSLIVFAALFSSISVKIYIEIFHRFQYLFRKRAPIFLRPLFGSLLAVPIILFLSTGETSALQPFEISRPGLAPLQDTLLGNLDLSALLLLTIGEAFVVGLRSGSSNSVGIFGPAMWVGGLSATIIGLINGSRATSVFTVAGISSGIASAMNFPLSSVVIVIETFGVKAAVPGIIGCIIGELVSKKWDQFFYKAKKMIVG